MDESKHKALRGLYFAVAFVVSALWGAVVLIGWGTGCGMDPSACNDMSAVDWAELWVVGALPALILIVLPLVGRRIGR